MLGFSPFNWLRSQARDAVIGGVSDALTVLTPPGEVPPTDLEALRLRLAAAVEPKALTAAPPAIASTTPTTTPETEETETKGKAAKKK